MGHDADVLLGIGIAFVAVADEFRGLGGTLSSLFVYSVDVVVNAPECIILELCPNL